MFGREAKLPVDLCFGTSPDGVGDKTYSRYVEKLQKDLQNAYELANRAADKSHQRNKKAYDQQVRFQAIDIGDRVLLRNLGLKGKHKLESRWNPVPYVVVGKLPGLPVYRVKPKNGEGGVKTLHRDHLLPVSQTLRIPESRGLGKSHVRPKTHQQAQNRVCGPGSVSPEMELDLSDSSSEAGYVVTRRRRGEQLQNLYSRSDGLGSGVRHQNKDEANPELMSVQGEEPESEGEEELEPFIERQLEPTEDDVEGAQVFDSYTSDSDPDPDEYEKLISGSKAEPTSSTKTDTDFRPRQKSTRQPKPVIRLTYDVPGKAKDQPLTIVHKGVIIKLGY